MEQEDRTRCSDKGGSSSHIGVASFEKSANLSASKLMSPMERTTMADKNSKTKASLLATTIANLLVHFLFHVRSRSFGSFSYNPLSILALIGSLAVTCLLIRVVLVSSSRERMFLVLALGVVAAVSSALFAVGFGSCFTCARYQSLGLAGDWSEWMRNENEASSKLYSPMALAVGNVLFDKNDEPSLQVCRECVSSLFTIFSFFNFDEAQGEDEEPVVVDEKNVSSYHDLIQWYDQWASKSAQSNTQSTLLTILGALSSKGNLNDRDIYQFSHDFLCSPASRFDNPDIITFLSAIETPRFTGEDPEHGTTIAPTKLQTILRDDQLRAMGPSLCFMLRFALAIPDDPKIERKPLGLGRDLSAPKRTMSEVDMKAQKGLFHFPGLVIAGLDPDVDEHSSQIKTTKSLIELYRRFPFEDEPMYFDTREEYLAFFRWNVEDKIQDEWYFPHWLNKKKLPIGSGKELVDETSLELLRMNRIKHSPDLSTVESSTSDSALSDRVFFGTGQFYMTAMKIPSDDDYEFSAPGSPKFYLTSAHAEVNRIRNKPTVNDLSRMVKRFALEQGIGSFSSSSPVKLDDWRDRIVEVDFSASNLIETRPEFRMPGVILYLDKVTKKPMGIWECDCKRMFFSDEGRDWEHAKFSFRVTERAVLTLRHVADLHFGWSHSVSVAVLQTLPLSHPVHALLKPFIWGVHVVNSAAYHMLVRDDSILVHAGGTTTKGLHTGFGFNFQHINFNQTIPEFLESKKLGNNFTKDMPLFDQGLRLYNAHRDFVKQFLTYMYKNNEEMTKDKELLRFWHHVNTYGRHLDPCVCDMQSEDFFYDGESTWPQFETSNTCEVLLDFSGFELDINLITRRSKWCKLAPFERISTLRNMLESQCDDDNDCKEIFYSVYHMKENMGLGKLQTIDQLVDFISTMIWETTAGHSIAGDNIPYLTDPENSAVRLRWKDENNELPLRTDISTYVFGTSIGALTTSRSSPLLADWTPIYKSHSELQSHMSEHEREERFAALNGMHLSYKMELLKLSNDFLVETSKRPLNQRYHALNPATQESSMAV